MSKIQLYLDWMGKFSENHRGFLIRFGRLESKLLTYDIEDILIEKPVFVTGLARAGTTIILEILNTHSHLSSHHYGDYPFPHVNYFWAIARRFFPAPKGKAERAHQDRLQVNTQSPEAMDEMIWMSFFSHLHDTDHTQSCILNQDTKHKAFENFFTKHMQKLLFLRKGQHYLSKNNYNFTRIAYLQKHYPDARFIIPLRTPEAHIYSLCKQHRLIAEAQGNDPRALIFMRAQGHFEFGLDFRPVCLKEGCPEHKHILELWEEGRIIEAYAHYWDYIYRYLYEQIAQNKALSSACHFVRYDDLCRAPEQEIKTILDFCDLEPQSIPQNWAEKISAPEYYSVDFTKEERALITQITAETCSLFWPKT